MQRLISLQHADGCWDLTPELAAALGARLVDLEKMLDRMASRTDASRQLWATALAVAWLEKKAGDAANEWRLLAFKARQWLNDSAGPAGLDFWLDAARTYAKRG